MDVQRRTGISSITLSALLAAAALAAAQPRPARSAPPSPPTAAELDSYLERHVLAPRFPACVDREQGGFHANFATDWTRQPDRHRFIVYQARNTWNAATVALARPALKEEYLGYTRHGTAFLRDRMWDKEQGGFFDAVALDGTPESSGGGTKMTYGQAFGVYALAVAHRATGDPEALELARRGYEWVEAHCREQGRPGYVSGVRRDGSPIPADVDAVAPGREVAGMGVPAVYRDMNTSIHVLEALDGAAQGVARRRPAREHPAAVRAGARLLLLGARHAAPLPRLDGPPGRRSLVVRARRGDRLPAARGGRGPRRAGGPADAPGRPALRRPRARARLERPRPDSSTSRASRCGPRSTTRSSGGRSSSWSTPSR